MDEFAGRAGVITGGAGLLGRGMANRFARAGMHIAVVDMNAEAAQAVADQVAADHGVRTIALATDVSDRSAVDAMAQRAYDEFGRIDLLCNNAGAAVLKPFAELTPDDWDRVLGVQFHGVLHGIWSFLPRMIAQGGDAHIVNTSSMSGVGLASMRALNAPYVTAKFAVVGLTEVMAPALVEHGIGVSVLCPGFTVADPEAFEGPWAMPSAAWYRHNLLATEQVADEVFEGVREGRLHIFPHRAGLGEVQGRHELLLEGFRQAERTSPPIDG
jgi:NAD(P)-dependent dehydrogenase (short-subunit alcohol dehydrogenase family)